MVRLSDHMAAVTSELVNMSKLASRLGVDGKTVDRWMSLLEHVFLIRRYPGLASQWFEASGQGTEVMILDSGLLAAFRRTGVADVARDRQRLGPLLECFVHAELAKGTTLCEDPSAISHYRDKGGSQGRSGAHAIARRSCRDRDQRQRERHGPSISEDRGACRRL